MARHYFNLSKHKIKDKMNLLKLIELLINEHCDLPVNVKVELPVTIPWDGVIDIPNASLAQVAQAVHAYYDITQKEFENIRDEYGLGSDPPYDKLPVASLSYTEVTISLEGYTPARDLV